MRLKSTVAKTCKIADVNNAVASATSNVAGGTSASCAIIAMRPLPMSHIATWRIATQRQCPVAGHRGGGTAILQGNVTCPFTDIGVGVAVDRPAFRGLGLNLRAAGRIIFCSRRGFITGASWHFGQVSTHPSIRNLPTVSDSNLACYDPSCSVLLLAAAIMLHCAQPPSVAPIGLGATGMLHNDGVHLVPMALERHDDSKHLLTHRVKMDKLSPLHYYLVDVADMSKPVEFFASVHEARVAVESAISTADLLARHGIVRSISFNNLVTYLHDAMEALAKVESSAARSRIAPSQRKSG